VQSIHRNGLHARVYDGVGTLMEATRAKGEKLWGWADGRLIECYPGGRRIDWTRLYCQLESDVFADKLMGRHG
jgi:hypothetical protein